MSRCREATLLQLSEKKGDRVRKLVESCKTATSILVRLEARQTRAVRALFARSPASRRDSFPAAVVCLFCQTFYKQTYS